MTADKDLKLVCPKCKSGDNIDVVAEAVFSLKDGELVDPRNHSMDSSMPAYCGCGWDGLVGQLRKPTDVAMKGQDA
jgi:hypothetical protein